MMKFEEITARLDLLEEIEDDWPRAMSRSLLSRAIKVAEAEAMEGTPVTKKDRAWVFARIERSIENEWSEEDRAPLLQMLNRALPG